jgi:hypothetical protein
LRLRRAKPYVCVDCDYADHFRFQETKDIDAAAGTWLRCLAHSRAQEQDGVVRLAWLRRTFVTTFERIEELVSVGLLKKREDGDYEIHAYAPRNQTRAMLDEDRVAARERMAAGRTRPRKHRATNPGSANERRTDSKPSRRVAHTGARSAPLPAPQTSPAEALSRDEGALSRVDSRAAGTPLEPSLVRGVSGIASRPEEIGEVGNVRPNIERTSTEREANKQRTNAFVPTSTSSSINSSSSSLSLSDQEILTDTRSEGGVQRGEARPPAVGTDPAPEAAGRRPPLPPSERGVSGSAWLDAFTEGISAITKRPCTAGRLYLGTLERLVSHHAPTRDAPSACAWLRAEAKAFARKWDGKNPPKGLTPDGLERWLNEGRQGPPTFGKERILQLPPEEWHEDDFSDLGAEVLG